MNKTHYSILTGAGFSANWGGWLAGELWSVLYGNPKIQKNEQLRQKLWSYRQKGFESAYAGIQKNVLKGRLDKSVQDLFTEAIIDAFNDMNNNFPTKKVLNDTRELNGLGQIFFKVGNIFTLNQDLLVEQIWPKKNSGTSWYLDDKESPFKPYYYPYIIDQCFEPNTWLTYQRAEKVCNQKSITIPAAMDFTNKANNISEPAIPYIKLHGSVNWVNEDGGNSLVIGDNKEDQLAKSPLLSKYMELFKDAISTGKARLLIIGYGFKDSHINDALSQAVKERGLQIFIIDSSDLDVLIESFSEDGRRNKKNAEKFFEDALISHCRSGLVPMFLDNGSKALDGNRIKEQFFLD